MKLFNEHKTAIILLSLILILSFLSSLKNDNLNEDSKEEISNTEVEDNRDDKNTQSEEKVVKSRKPTTTKTTTPSFEGIGARLQQDIEYPTIYEVIPDGPAYRSGKLEKGDKIIGVSQGDEGVFEDIIGWKIDDVVSKIKGPKGSVVRLLVMKRESEFDDYPDTLSLERDVVDVVDEDAPVSGGGSDEIKVTGVTSGTLVAKKTRRNYILKRSSVQLDIDWPKDSKKSKHLFYKVSINNKYVTSLSDYNFNESFKANIGDVVRIDRKTKRSFNSYKFCTSFVILENKYQYLITCK